MKSNIKITMVAGMAAVLGLAASCTDLDVDVNSQYTSYPNSEIAISAKMADLYYAFAGPLGRRYNEAQSLSSDEYVGESFDNNYVDNFNYSNMSLHTFTPDDPATGYYDEVSSGISKANQIILELGGDKADSATIAPAKAMRAFFNFILMDSYGDVPILDHVPEADDVIERQPRADVAKFIEKDLKEAIPYLSAKNDMTTYGKPNKWMAKALLAKLYINWAVYTASDVTKYDAATATNEKLDDCVKVCDDIIQSGLFDLTSTQRTNPTNVYRAKFYPDNNYKVKDFIYAMPYDAVLLQGMTYARFRTWKKANKGDTYYGWSSGNSFAGVFAMTPEMADRFSLEGDDRNDVVIGGYIKKYDPKTYEKTDENWTYNGEPQFVNKTITLKAQNNELNVGENPTGYNQGWKSIKFYPSQDDYVNHKRNQSNDVPIFRYADILLEKAEAITRGAKATNGDTPQSLFNQIRAYVHAPQLDHNPSLQEILDERGREFLDENWRRNDMIRFGTFESEFGYHIKSFSYANFDKTRRIFPIPTSTLKVNSNWKQNVGY